MHNHKSISIPPICKTVRFLRRKTKSLAITKAFDKAWALNCLVLKNHPHKVVHRSLQLQLPIVLMAAREDLSYFEGSLETVDVILASIMWDGLKHTLHPLPTIELPRICVAYHPHTIIDKESS